MGICYIELRAYSKAQNFIAKAYNFAEENNDVNLLHQSLNRQAQLEFLNHNFDEAQKAYEDLLSGKMLLSNWEKSFAYAGLAEVFLSKNKIEAAEKNALEALKYSKEINSFWDIHRSASILHKVYLQTGDENNKSYYNGLKNQYEDSLYNRSKVRDINLLQLEQKEKENLLLAQEKEKSESNLFIIKILLGLVVVITFLVLIVLFQLRKTNKEKSRLNKELIKSNNQLIDINEGKNKMFSILSHDLRSPIASMLQLIELLKEGAFSEEEQKEVLGEMHLQLTSTSLMLQNLLKWASSQMENNEVNIVEVNLVEKVNEAVGVYNIIAKSKNIALLHEAVQERILLYADEAHLNVILHNLISNAIKYTPEHQEVKISYSVNKKVCLNIFNAGKPITQEKIKEIEDKDAQLASEKGTLNEYGTGLGLLLVKQYLKPNNATLTITPIAEKGTEFRICFKNVKQ